jgi:hypothetical protein
MVSSARSRRSHSRFVGLGCSLALVVLLGARLGAATITVCASGCSFSNSQLQNAIDAATNGDVILLQENFIYSGQFVLTDKPTCAAGNDTCYTEIRTGVTSTGSVINTSTFPAANIRMTPALAANKLAILRTTSATQAALRADAPPVIPKYWRLKWLQFDALEGGSGTGAMVSYGSTSITTEADLPSRFQVVQCFFRGSPVQGQHRAMSFGANFVTVQDSYIKDIKTFGQSGDGNAIWIHAGDTFLITNNYLEGGTETVFTGSTPCCLQSATITGGASTTGATLSHTTDLPVGKWISVEIAAVEWWVQVATKVGNVVTWAPALPSTPDVPGDVDWSPVPSNLTLTKNILTRPVAWRQPIVGTPQNVSASPGGTGTLAAGTYFYKVVARHPTQTGTTARSSPSGEASCIISVAPGRCTITWSAVTNATTYYIYGRSSGGQNIRWSVTAPTVTYADNGTAGTTEAVPTSSGSVWTVKNTLEFKAAKTVLVEGNIIENSWNQAQIGSIVLFTPTAQGSVADSAIVQDVILRNNIIRHGFQAMQLRCRYDDTGPSVNWTISNNLFYDINLSWGDGTQYQFIWSVSDNGWPPAGGEPGCHGDNYFDHNTIDPAGTTAAYVYLSMNNSGVDQEISNLRYRSNIFIKGTYGLFGASCTMGDNCWTTYTDTDRVFDKNIVADGTCSGTALPNPANQFCPTYATLLTNFVSQATGNYRLTTASPYNNAGHDGTDVGANIDTIEAFTSIAISGNNSGAPPPPAPTITTLALPNGITGSLYSATLQATGGTTPYTWAVAVGTLPTGLVLNASTGAITGTPTIEGPSDFTVSVTGGGQTAPKNFSILITAPANPSDRPIRFATYMEAITFRRDTAPGEEDQALVGDLWFDLVEGVLKVCTATSPDYVWSPVTTGGTPTDQINITLRADGAVYTMTDLTSTEINSSRHHRTRVDLTDYDECRLIVKVTTAGSTGLVRWTYDIDNLGEDLTYTEVAGSDVSLSALGLIAGPWVAIPAPAKTDVFIGNRVSGGNGTEDPAVSNVYFQCRKTP